MMNRAMRVVAFIGPSNSGKTTLICGLIRHFVTEGKTVAAIKHTHHRLNEERKGNTGAFEAAGASPVILAGDGGAVIFEKTTTRWVSFATPADLLMYLHADLVLVEGFKAYEAWPRVNAADVASVEDALALLDTIA